jgi:hypothetical protein
MPPPHSATYERHAAKAWVAGRWLVFTQMVQPAVLIEVGVAVQGGDSAQLTMNSCSATPHRR